MYYQISEIYQIHNNNDITYFKYTSITSFEVDGSFSIYKILSDNRRSFLFENIKKHFVQIRK